MSEPDPFNLLGVFFAALWANTFEADPWLWTMIVCGLIGLVGMANELGEHRGWRAMLWALAAAIAFSAAIAIAPAEPSSAALGLAPS